MMRSFKKLLVGFLLLVLVSNVSGCGRVEDEPPADTGDVSSESSQSDNETEETIFHWGTEEYFYLLEGEWTAVEYVGTAREYHFDEATAEGYQEQMQENTDIIIEEYLGSEYCIEIDNLKYFGPYTDLDIIMEDADDLFLFTRFVPGEFITLTPPYIGLTLEFADEDGVYYHFIIDADGTVLIDLKNRFFRLERKSDEEAAGEADRLLQDADEEARDDLDGWIGEYTFGEYAENEIGAMMFMDYNIDIYKENGQYYADVVVNGHLTGINLKAKLYGNEEWVSLVIAEYNPDHITGLSEKENTVLLSLRKQGEEIYTYWGVLEAMDVNLPCSGIYLEKAVAEAVSAKNTEGESGLEDWVGTYTFSEKTSAASAAVRDYDITIQEENGQYYGDLRITGGDTGIDVKTQIYGNEEWISLVLVEYNPEHESGLEDMENGVLLSLRKRGNDIYTYWGGRPVTQLLRDDYFAYYDYYDSVRFFKEAVD